MIWLILLVLPSFADASDRLWRFRVFLDDKQIGYHEFQLSEQEGQQRLLRSEANFEYKLLFLKLYGYEHENVEVWNGDCLTRIDSRTDANGEPFAVKGALTDNAFVLDDNGTFESLPPCVMSFAYWNPTFLQQERLLNSQNGEYVDVAVSEPAQVQIEVRGTVLPALRYRLESEQLGIELWYSQDQQWLGLEADTESGRKLRYELI
jgi:hypothetical protein